MNNPDRFLFNPISGKISTMLKAEFSLILQYRQTFNLNYLIFQSCIVTLTRIQKHSSRLWHQQTIQSCFPTEVFRPSQTLSGLWHMNTPLRSSSSPSYASCFVSFSTRTWHLFKTLVSPKLNQRSLQHLMFFITSYSDLHACSSYFTSWQLRLSNSFTTAKITLDQFGITQTCFHWSSLQ